MDSDCVRLLPAPVLNGLEKFRFLGMTICSVGTLEVEVGDVVFGGLPGF